MKTNSNLGAVCGVVLIAAFSACPPKPTEDAGHSEVALDAGPADAGVDGGTVDAGPPKPAELHVELATGSSDGGLEPVPIDQAGAQLEATRSLVVFIDAPLQNYRVQLLDWADQVVQSDEAASTTDGGIDYRILPAEPLKAGRSYTLQIEAQTGETITDVRGREYDDVRVALKIKGELAPEPGKAKPKKKR